MAPFVPRSASDCYYNNSRGTVHRCLQCWFYGECIPVWSHNEWALSSALLRAETFFDIHKLSHLCTYKIFVNKTFRYYCERLFSVRNFD